MFELHLFVRCLTNVFEFEVVSANNEVHLMYEAVLCAQSFGFSSIKKEEGGGRDSP